MSNSIPKGPIAWMASNPVAANLIMIALLGGGLMTSTKIKQEVMPEFEMDIVSINIPYPGASPAEVEQSILLAVEEQVRGLDDIKKVTAQANEGMAAIQVELIKGSNANKSLQDIKNAIDRITSFPDDIERPQISLRDNRREVISLVLYGDFDEDILRGLAEQVRAEILDSDNITNAELSGVRPLEISIEVPQEQLRAHGLTLGRIADEVRRAAIELPAGGVKTRGGEILLRTAERKDFGQEYAKIPIVTRADGTRVVLGDIATIEDGFRDTDEAAYFGEQRAIQIRVFRLGDQKPISIAEEIKRVAADLEVRLPPGVGIAVWYDASEMYESRVDLLIRNFGLGLTLVLIALGLFLEIRLAFWVMMGIPISILGAFLIFPTLAVSINMISLFAFIITLGIVVDDAVVVGENIFEKREAGLPRLQAAVEGAREVAVPVTFSILTNIVAFAPMLFVPGFSGKFFSVIPIIVISVFLVSLFESLFILPAHLAHQKPSPETGYRAALRRGQRRFGSALASFVNGPYRRILNFSLRFRYAVVAAGIFLLLVTVGMIAGGRIDFSYMPKIDTDLITANAELTFGAPVEDTVAVQRRIAAAAREVVAENGGDAILKGVYSTVGSGINAGMGPMGNISTNGGHLAGVAVYLVGTDERAVSATEFARQWRARLDDLTGLESLRFDYSTGPSSGPAIDIELIHRDILTLQDAASDLAAELGNYAGVKDINDGFSAGKPQYDVKIKPEARALGVTAADLGGQLRDAFYGARAFRQQRGREELWVMVRLPDEERRAESDIDAFMVRTPMGGEIPLAEAAVLDRGNAYTQIKRNDGRRVVNVTADVNVTETNANKVLEDVVADVLPGLIANHPGLGYTFSGQQKEQAETMASLRLGFIAAMGLVFLLLAIPFKSYLQPILVMSAIPFGFVGAVIGHVIMGFELSIISIMGLVALSGVVVNDSLVFIHMANENRRSGQSAKEAITNAGMRRFRPILLTSLTTFCGLAPMMFETSVQARFLIPMAISLGYGIVFATAIILLLIPAFYMILEDLRNLYGLNASEQVKEEVVAT